MVEIGQYLYMQSLTWCAFHISGHAQLHFHFNACLPGEQGLASYPFFNALVPEKNPWQFCNSRGF